MIHLVRTTEIYRADSESEAQYLINEAKEDSRYTLTKYDCEQKETKAKGEVIDTYSKVSLTKVFNNIKEPESIVTIEYEVD